MGLVLSQSVGLARSILQDTDAGFKRYSDADLLAYANDALDQMVTLLPSLFYAEGEVQCIEGTLQSVSFSDARALVDVRRIKNGGAVIPCSQESLDRFKPNWHLDPPAPAVNWMGITNDPVRFLIYPQAPQGQILEVMFVRNPPVLGMNDGSGIPVVYADAVADYIVYRAESRDDEHVNSQRAQTFYQSFVAKLQGG